MGELAGVCYEMSGPFVDSGSWGSHFQLAHGVLPVRDMFLVKLDVFEKRTVDSLIRSCIEPRGVR